MAILELVVNQSFYNQLVVNRFHYVMSGTPAAVTPSFALISATGYIPPTPPDTTFVTDTLADAHQDITSSDLSFVSSYARNLYSVTDFYEAPYINSITGEQTGDSASPAVAYGFFSSRVRTDVRRGMKRFCGVSETRVQGGGTITSAFLPSLVNMADRLGETLSYDDEGNTLTFIPCILGLEEYTTPAGNRAYRPYATEATQLTHTAQGISWAPYAQTRTQVSRQYARGA
jgi:hypothetical protein